MICVGETKKSGAGVPFRVTVTPLISVGRRTALAAPVSMARLVPKTEAVEPGDSGPEV